MDGADHVARGQAIADAQHQKASRFETGPQLVVGLVIGNQGRADAMYVCDEALVNANRIRINTLDSWSRIARHSYWRRPETMYRRSIRTLPRSETAMVYRSLKNTPANPA